MYNARITLTKFIIEEQRLHPGATGEFSGLLDVIATACKVISHAAAKGGLVGALAGAGCSGAAGDEPNRLDEMSNDIVNAHAEWGGHLSGMTSAQCETPRTIPEHYPRGNYLLVFSPLDGASNIDVNVAVGTIFSVLRAPKAGKGRRPPKPEDFLQAGTEQVCAGYALYGPATMLVLTTGRGVNGFTLDRDIGEFILSHPEMSIPETTQEFAINTSNSRFWEPPVKRYVEECLAGRNGGRGKDFNMRWIASLVAETHRILTRGGVFLYPRDHRDPARAGRLRLLHEANPIAFIVEQAGGACSTGRERVLGIRPEALHQPVPMIFGSKAEVDLIARYHDEHDRGIDQPYRSPLFNERGLFVHQ